MNSELKQKLLENQFGLELLHGHVDQGWFDELCDIFSQDIQEESGVRNTIDKEVAYFIVELISIMRYRAEPSEGKDRGGEQVQLMRLLRDFERLILEKYLV